MFRAALILILSSGFFLFYLQVVCQKILRRQFERELWQEIVKPNDWGFSLVRKALEGFGDPLEYRRLILTLKCDFIALTYLLKNTANDNQRYTYEERLLMLYFKLGLVSLDTRHLLGLREAPAVLKLVTILKYFADVVAERKNNRRNGGGFLPPHSPSLVTISGLEA